jgi:chromosome segregation ATPase
MEMSDELRQKQIECDNVQRSFDEYVESSKELESELEIALEESEAKIAELTKKKVASDERAKDLNDRLGQTSKEFSKCQTDLIIARENEAKADELKKLLEVANEDLNNRVRILEATEEDLKHKLSNMEEDIVFLQGDLQGMDNVKIEIEDKMNREITELKKALEEMKINVDDSAKNVPTVSEDNSDLLETLTNEMNKAIEALQIELSEAKKRSLDVDAQNIDLCKTVESLQAELSEMTSRSTEAEAQNNELMEELTKVTEEVVTLQDTIRQTTDRLVIAKKTGAEDKAAATQLRQEVDVLTAELVASKAQVVEVLARTCGEVASAEEGDVSELRNQLAAQETLMAELREQTAAFIEISLGEKQQLEAEMARQIYELSTEIASLKYSQVANSDASSSAVEAQLMAQIELLTSEVAALKANPPLSGIASTAMVETATVSRLPKPVAKLPIALSNPLVFSAAALSSASGMSAHAAALIASGDLAKLGNELLRVVSKVYQWFNY